MRRLDLDLLAATLVTGLILVVTTLWLCRARDPLARLPYDGAKHNARLATCLSQLDAAAKSLRPDRNATDLCVGPMHDVLVSLHGLENNGCSKAETTRLRKILAVIEQAARNSEKIDQTRSVRLSVFRETDEIRMRYAIPLAHDRQSLAIE